MRDYLETLAAHMYLDKLAGHTTVYGDRKQDTQPEPVSTFPIYNHMLNYPLWQLSMEQTQRKSKCQKRVRTSKSKQKRRQSRKNRKQNNGK